MSEGFLEIERGNYISRIWFMGAPGAGFDVLMTLTRRLPDGDWILKYRFRHYRDAKAFDSEDERSYSAYTLPRATTEADAVRKLAPVVDHLAARTGLDCDVTVVESDDPVLVVHLLRGKPFAHVRHGETKS